MPDPLPPTDRRTRAAHELLDAWLDRRHEAAAPLEPVLAACSACGLDAAGIETLLRAGRAAYPAAPRRRGLHGPLPLPCEHVDHATAYLVHVPAAYDPASAWPLLVVAHGGSAARDLAFGEEAARAGLEPWLELAERDGLLLLAPLTDRGWGAIGYSILFSALARATREYHVDPDRVYVTGHSMGGHLAWRCGINFADRWGAIAPMSGGYDFVADGEIANLVNVPGYATWGSHEPYGIAAANRANAAWLAQHTPEWVNVECVGGHEIFPDELPAIARFFASHPRRLYRSSVTARAGGPLAYREPDAHPAWGHAHAWRAGRPIGVSTFHWLRLAPLPQDTPPERAVQQARAEVRAGNAIAIETVNVRALRVHLHPRMVDLARPVTVTVNGVGRFRGRVTPDPAAMLELVREFDDRGRIFHAAIDIEVADADRASAWPA